MKNFGLGMIVAGIMGMTIHLSYINLYNVPYKHVRKDGVTKILLSYSGNLMCVYGTNPKTKEIWNTSVFYDHDPTNSSKIYKDVSPGNEYVEWDEKVSPIFYSIQNGAVHISERTVVN